MDNIKNSCEALASCGSELKSKLRGSAFPVGQHGVCYAVRMNSALQFHRCLKLPLNMVSSKKYLSY